MTVREDVAARSVPLDEAKVRDYGLARVFPVFSLAFSAVYFFGVYTGYGPIRFYPVMGEWHIIWSTAPLPNAVGPVMMWYGWVINGTIAGLIGAGLALLAPAEVFNRIWSRWVWAPVAVTIVLIVWLLFLLRGYFVT